jgi:hypothetical protein
MDLAEQVNKLLLQGYCCSQIIMKLGLDEMNRDNEELVKAMKGLCQGMYAGTVCGTLSAASCLLFLLSMRNGQQLSRELTDWFKEEFGSIDCPALLGDDPVGSSLKLCPVIIRRTFEEIMELAGRHNLSWTNGD